MALTQPTKNFLQPLDPAVRKELYDALSFTDDVTAGTAAAGKAVVLNASKGITTITSATITTLSANSINLASGAVLTVGGGLRSSHDSQGIGYTTGAGGAVTQLTNRTTAVTLDRMCGTITTNTASLAAEGTAKFTVNNASVAIGDTVIVCQQSGSNSGGTIVAVTTVAAGSFEIAVHNGNVAAGTAETGAILINFAIIKAVSA